MPKHNLTLAIFLLVSVAIAILVMQVVRHDEVLSTTVLYLIEDANNDHGNKNLMIGSSSLKRLEQQEILQCGPWLNRGIGSSKISSLSRYLSLSKLAVDPSLVLIYAGENDISTGMSSDEVFERYKAFIQQLEDKFPDSVIHIFGIKPSPRRRSSWDSFNSVNTKVQAYVRDLPEIYFHPLPGSNEEFSQSGFLNDGIHLTEQGYKLFTSGFNETCATQ